MTMALAATAMAAKMAAALTSVLAAGAPVTHAVLWLLGTGGDAMLVLSYAVVAWFASTRRPVLDRPAAGATVHALLIALGAFLMLYLLANVHIFQLLGTPLNVRYLVWTGGRGTEIATVLKEEPPYVSVGMMLAALVLVPVLMTVVRRRLIESRPRAWTRRTLARMLVVLFVWGLIMSGLSLIPPVRAELGMLRLNPVLSFLHSTLEVLTGGSEAREVEIDRHQATLFDVTSPFPEVEIEPGCPIARPVKPVRNVVLFIMESWTAQDQQLFGGEKRNTPNLARLAPHSLRMTRYHTTSPASIKALFSIFCSMHPYPEFKFITTVNPRIPCDSISEVLERHDYDSALLHGGKFAYTNKLAFFDDRGFDLIVDAQSIPGKDKYFSYGYGIDDKATVDLALEWIAARGQRPFFVAFIPIIPHYPYVIPDHATPRFSTETLKSRYHNGIAYLDEQLGRLYDDLEARGLADETLIVIASDHGQAFLQHKNNRMHTNCLYQENTWVPLYLINRQLFPGGRSCDRIATHVDLAPTILDALGLEVPEHYQGRSIFEQGPPHMAILSTMYRDRLIGIRDGPYKYILNIETQAEELYDLRSDPAEKKNIAHQHADRTRAYRERVEKWRAFQRTLIENYASLTGLQPENQEWEAMGDLLRGARVWLEYGGKVRPCDELEEMEDDSRHWRARVEGWRCQGARKKVHAGVKYMLVGGSWRTCIRMHPPAKGAMRISVPLEGEVGDVSGRIAIEDASVKAGGTPVTFRFGLGGEEWTSVTIPNKVGLTGWQVSGPGTSLEIELTAEHWRNRVACLIIDDTGG